MRCARLTAPLLGLLALAACGGERAADTPARRRPDVLARVPILVPAVLTDTTGTEDTDRRSFLVDMPFDTVAAYYRRMLPASGWLIMNDRGDSTILDLYARRGDTTVWVHVEPRGRGTAYTLIGSAPPPAPR